MDPEMLIPDPVNSAMNLHPMFVHFPVALLPVSLAILLLAWWRDNDRLMYAAKVCLVAGTLGAVAAVISGLIAEDSIPHNETIHRMMETHESAAITVLCVTIVLAVWSHWISLRNRKNLLWFVCLLSLTSCLLVSVGDLGARMVFQQGAGVAPAVSVITEGSAEADAGHVDHEHRSPGMANRQVGHVMTTEPYNNHHV